ncbi:MAG: hypothetical protein R3D85_04945 [Paracoccaceae bacterium]
MTTRPEEQPAVEGPAEDYRISLVRLLAAEKGGLPIWARWHRRNRSHRPGLKPGEVPAPIGEEPPEKVWAEFRALIASYLGPDQGYLSRRAMFDTREAGDYDQLARFGEWDITDDLPPRC